MPCLEQPARLRPLAGGILDRLCLVENHVVEVRLAELEDVAPQRPVGGDHHVVGAEVADHLAPVRAGVIGHLQGRCEPPGLVDPVEDQALGDDHEAGPPRDGPRGRRAHTSQE